MRFNKTCCKNNKTGFTLAETLITLLIIGVIAVMTVPVLLSNYAEQERHTRVKKAYAVLTNAMIRVKADGGDMIFDVQDGNTGSIKNWYNTYLKNYLVTLKVCYDTEGCWNKGDTKYLKGGNVYCNRHGKGIGDNIVTAILADGIFINIDSYGKDSIAGYFGVDIDTPSGLVIFFDINGERKPNVAGKDIFVTVFTEKGLIPAYSSRTAAQINADCSSSGTGYSCLQKSLHHK